MVNRALDIVLIGPPGAGKGTQGRLLADAFGLLHISIGELLRREIDDGSELGGEAQTYVESGKLVPDSLARRMLVRWLHSQPGAMGCVFDGYPRNARQAEILDGLLAQLGRRVDVALYLEVPDDVALDRVEGKRACRECGRPASAVSEPENGHCAKCGGVVVGRHENRATAEERLRVHRRHAEDILALYDGRGILRRVGGVGGEEQVFCHLRAAMEGLVER
jgi:adenylate kinase